MFDSSHLPNVDHLSLEHPVEVAYAAQMAAREHALHSIFGPTEPPDHIMSPSDAQLFLHWPGGGVYQYPPRTGRPSWHYVTCGLSQPRIDDEGVAQSIVDDDGERYSGFGIELVISTAESVGWASDVLVNLVKYLLFQENARVILPGDRIPCGGPLVLETNTQLNHLVATNSDQYETEILLPAGHCSLVHLVGCTQGEIDQAMTMGRGTAGSIVLSRVLRRMGVNYDSLPDRRCLTENPEFEDTWKRARAECEVEWASAPNTQE